jgi:transposase
MHARGWSHRRIARELCVNRRTVVRYAQASAKCTIPIPGPEAGLDSKCTISTPGSGDDPEAKSTIVPPGPAAVRAKAGRRSGCEPYASDIATKVEKGLSARRIYQDLVVEHGFAETYQCVKRYVRKIKASAPERVWRMESHPGEEAQVDFGVGATIVDEQGKRTRTWVLRVVLSHSRKGYSEAVLRQDTETFLRVLENAIRSFGGAPLTLNVDNLKAAVTKADWYDPQINPKLAEFCRHYSMSVLPCRPYTPEHKGKVESGVKYVRGNALKGLTFASNAAQNRHLLHWEATVADKRIHGTTRRQVDACFEEERPFLQPLPATLFPYFLEARRSVHRDSYVEVAKAYYEAPPEYIGRKVWVRWDSRCVRIFNDRMEQVRLHTRLEPGKFSRNLGTGGLSTPVRHACEHWVSKASVYGEHCGQWARSAAEARGPEALRAIIGLCNLVRKHPASAVDAACAEALKNGCHSYKGVKALLGQEATQADLSFTETHPLIRNLDTYSDFINQTQTNDTSNQHPQTTRPEATPVRAA